MSAFYASMPKMTPFEAFKLYTAYHLHFSSPKYDVIKYNGRTKASPTSFDTRKDKVFFQKLGRHKDPQGLLVANFVDGKPKWIGDIVQGDIGERVYLSWLARQQAITYTYTNDLALLMDSFDDNFAVVKGEHPPLLTMHLQGKVCKETLIILNALVKYFGRWNKKIGEQYIWPPLYHTLHKYRPFVKFDEAKMRAITIKRFA